MSKRYLIIIAVSGLLAIIALVGYGLPGSEPLIPVKELPDRILLENAGGKVVFDHKLHFTEYKVECQACHHEREKPTPLAIACGSCHGAVDKPDFKAKHVTEFKDQLACVTCHHAEFSGVQWDHAAHVDLVDKKCATCHHDDERSQPEPQKCSTCHTLAAEGKKPDLASAVHLKCSTAECHASEFANNDVNKCSYCHNLIDTKVTLRDKGWINLNPTYANCAVCHIDNKVDDLIPSRMQAFHESCMGCHEKQGKGPFGKDQCNQCHTK